MLKFEGVETFIAAAEQGSLSAAARMLGVSRSVVSERLADLERDVNARLIQRTTRRMTLTEDGIAFLPRARRILQEVSTAAAELAERRGELTGSLRISAPVSFGYLHLGPALYPFLQRHPGIDLTLDLDDRFVDIEADGYDAVIRHGPIRAAGVVALKLAQSCRRLVASASYLGANGTPQSVSDLEGHRAILYTNRTSDWRFVTAGSVRAVQPQRAFRVNNGLVMRDAAVAGLGIALLPSFLTHREVQQGILRIVDVGAEPEPAEINLAFPDAQRPSAKLRAVVDFLRDAFGTPPYWDIA